MIIKKSIKDDAKYEEGIGIDLLTALLLPAIKESEENTNENVKFKNKSVEDINCNIASFFESIKNLVEQNVSNNVSNNEIAREDVLKSLKHNEEEKNKTINLIRLYQEAIIDINHKTDELFEELNILINKEQSLKKQLEK